MKQPVDMPTELLISTLNANSELSLLAASYAGNFDSRKNGKRFKAEIDRIVKRQRETNEDIIRRHAPELLDVKPDRFEVIDHRECVSCRGRKTANYLQKDGSYKEQPCDKCDGSGIRGGRVFVANSNAETSNIEVQLSYQDDGKTLKVFIKDKENK